MRFCGTRAKKFLAKPGPDLATSPPTEIQKLVHELQMHQIELDMQNEELRRSQGETEAAWAKYADLYDFAPIGYFTFDPQGVILEANLTGARLLGVERGSLLRTPFVSHVAPAIPGRVHGSPAPGFCHPGQTILHLAVSHPRGRRPACGHWRALRSIRREAVPPNAALPSATARPANSPKTAWRRSEEKFHLLFDQAPLGYQSLDEEGRILEVNQTWLDLMGYSREEVQGRWFKAFLKPAHQDLFTEHFTRFKADGEANGVEWEMVRQDGTTIVASFNGRVIRDEQGRFLRTHCLFEDITARRQAERELKKSLSLLHSTLESTADGILVVDRPGRSSAIIASSWSLWRIPASVMATGDDRQALASVLDQLQSPEAFLAKVQELYVHPESREL